MTNNLSSNLSLTPNDKLSNNNSRLLDLSQKSNADNENNTNNANNSFCSTTNKQYNTDLKDSIIKIKRQTLSLKTQSIKKSLTSPKSSKENENEIKSNHDYLKSQVIHEEKEKEKESSENNTKNFNEIFNVNKEINTDKLFISKFNDVSDNCKGIVLSKEVKTELKNLFSEIKYDENEKENANGKVNEKDEGVDEKNNSVQRKSDEEKQTLTSSSSNPFLNNNLNSNKMFLNLNSNPFLSSNSNQLPIQFSKELGFMNGNSNPFGKLFLENKNFTNKIEEKEKEPEEEPDNEEEINEIQKEIPIDTTQSVISDEFFVKNKKNQEGYSIIHRVNINRIIVKGITGQKKEIENGFLSLEEIASDDKKFILYRNHIGNILFNGFIIKQTGIRYEKSKIGSHYVYITCIYDMNSKDIKSILIKFLSEELCMEFISIFNKFLK